MTAYQLMKRVIALGRTSKERMSEICDVYYAAGRLTDDEYTELIGTINASANTKM